MTFDAGDTLIADRWDPPGLLAECARARGAEPGPRELELARRAVGEAAAAAGDFPDEGAYFAYWREAGGRWAETCGWPARLGEQAMDDAAARVLDPAGGVLEVFDDAAPALDRLHASGYRLGVVSNWDWSLYPVLRAHGLAGWFDAVAASGPLGFAKPDPRIFAAALARLGVGPEEACHVGDDLEADYDGARAAGMAAIHLVRAGGGGAGTAVTLTEAADRLA